MRFEDRRDAGRRLAEELLAMQQDGELDAANAVVVALPRGGVPVGFEIAQALRVPLDVCVVRKVGAPMQPELAVAAVAEGGEMVVNEDICRALGLSREAIERLAQPKRQEVLERVNSFRRGRPAVPLEGKTAILVDDGVATGATALSAVHVLRKMRAGKVLLALPVCPPSTAELFAPEVDKLIVLSIPEMFYGVGQWYENFDQVSDSEVQDQLQRAGAFGRDAPA